MENMKELIKEQIEAYRGMMVDNTAKVVKLRDQIKGYKQLNENYAEKISRLSAKLKSIEEGGNE